MGLSGQRNVQAPGFIVKSVISGVGPGIYGAPDWG